MASTVAGAMVEKFGYLNIPVRKIGLHEYLVGKINLKDDFFKRRINEHIKEHNKKILIGGVSVQDRDTSKERQIVDQSLIKEDLENYQSKSFTSISEAYSFGRNLYAKAVCYKKSKHYPDKHIEYTTDIQKYKAQEIFSLYKKEFEDVYMINLHREFIGWLDSLVSQRFAHPEIKTRLFFVFHSARDLYFQYEESIKEMPGLHINFDDLFIPNQLNLIQAISHLIKEPIPQIKWEEEQYDLFGKISDFRKTFTKADSTPKHLSKTTIFFINKALLKNKITIFDDAILYQCYLIDFIIFKIKKFIKRYLGT